MGAWQKLRFLFAFCVILPQAVYSETPQTTHGNSESSSQSGAATTDTPREQAPESKLTPEEEARKKLLNNAADADPNLTEGRKALQSATESIWDSLSKAQQSELSTELAGGGSEKLDALLKQEGLVLSSPEKRERFLNSFQTQLSANSKRGSSEGLSQLIASANGDPKGDAQKRQEQLAAKQVLEAELKKNKPAVDFLKKNLGWSSEDSLMAVRRVEEQSKLLANGTPKQKAAAQDYLYRVFGPIYGAGMRNADKTSNAITELFANAELRESDFGKI